MQRLFERLENWINGVNTSAPSDNLPEGFSPRGRNSVFRFQGASAQIAKRKGAQCWNPTPITGSPVVLGQFQYKKRSGTNFHLIVSDTGRLDVLNANKTTSTVNATAFTSGTHYPAFETANDLCFITNDTDQKKYDGTTVTAFGITRPSAAPGATAGAGGAAGMSGTYDIATSYLNSSTGHESSRSDSTAVVVGGGQKVTITWAAPTDAQVDYVRIYVRKQTLGPGYYRAVNSMVPAPNATWLGFAVATTSTVLDLSDTSFLAYILPAPSTNENNPPPAGTNYPCWHESRMFVADAGTIYYSNLKAGVAYPEAFNPLNLQPVNPNDGDQIRALASHFGKLLIFKQFSVWQLIGSDPASWELKKLTSDSGISTHRSLATAEGAIYWWNPTKGPTQFDGTTLPASIAMPLIRETITPTAINQVALTSVVATVDDVTETIMWAIPELGATRNTLIIPYNYRAQRFSAEWWNPFDVASMAAVEDVDHIKAVYLGGYSGQLFKWGTWTNDGVAISTTTHGTVTAATSTTLTDSTATFDTTGSGLIERYCFAIANDGIDMQRRRITANTATELTVVSAWTLTPNTTYTYAVGGIDFQWDTPWMKSGFPFHKKRFEWLFVEASTADATSVVYADVFLSQDEFVPRRTFTLTLTGGGAVYDAATSIYDTSVYGSGLVEQQQKRIARVGQSWRVRIRSIAPDADLILLKIAMQAVLMSTKS